MLAHAGSSSSEIFSLNSLLTTPVMVVLTEHFTRILILLVSAVASHLPSYLAFAWDGVTATGLAGQVNEPNEPMLAV